MGLWTRTMSWIHLVRTISSIIFPWDDEVLLFSWVCGASSVGISQVYKHEQCLYYLAWYFCVALNSRRSTSCPFTGYCTQSWRLNIRRTSLNVSPPEIFDTLDIRYPMGLALIRSRLGSPPQIIPSFAYVDHHIHEFIKVSFLYYLCNSIRFSLRYMLIQHRSI